VASANLELLQRVAAHLGDLRERVVFVGCAVIELLITEPGASDLRVTADVDAVVEVASIGEYYAFCEALRAAGFREDRSEDAPACRWVVDRIKVDLMPPEDTILGFSNRWYAGTIRHADRRPLPGGPAIKVATAPYFLGTKLEAFAGRGKGDFRASHDIEDIVAVIDGRPELRAETRAADAALRGYLASSFQKLLRTPDFIEALPGHLSPDDASQRRLELVMARIEALARADR
jgi:predicted nucleotidyltransferase